MGLLDAALNAVSHHVQDGKAGGLGDLIGMISNNPQLLQTVTHLLSNDGSVGGLGGLIAKFQQAGLGDVVNSWIGAGPNQAISGEQLGHVLGNDVLSGLAKQLGSNSEAVAGQLSSVLPLLLDKLTPAGQAPAGGLGNAGELAGALGSISSLFNR